MGQKASKDYTRLAPIGNGSFGHVFKVQHVATGEIFALKTIRVPDDDARRSAWTEANALALLTHENLVKCHAFFEDRHFFRSREVCIVMDYCSLGTLRPLISRDRLLPMAHVLDIITQTSAGVNYLHSNGILHRDLKPENTLLHPNPTRNDAPMEFLFTLHGAPVLVKISDLGISSVLQGDQSPVIQRMQEDESKHRGFFSRRRSSCFEATAMPRQSTNSLAGTLPYMAPEVITGSAAFPSDIFSLGIIFAELLTGTTSHLAHGAGENLRSLLVQVITARPCPVRHYALSMMALCPTARPIARNVHAFALQTWRDLQRPRRIPQLPRSSGSCPPGMAVVIAVLGILVLLWVLKLLLMTSPIV